VHVFNCHFSRGKQVDPGDGLVAYGHETLGRVHVYSGEVVEVLEDGAVGRAHGKFDLGELGQHSEVAHLLVEQHLPVHGVPRNLHF